MYLKMALRHIWKKKRNTFLNVAGLSIGIAACLLIVQYALHELSYDKYHNDVDQKFRVATDIYREGNLNLRSSAAYAALGPVLKKEYPEVKGYMRLFHVGSYITREAKRFREDATFFADSNFFSFFSFPLINGNKQQVLSEPNSVVISEEMAKKYFNSVECVGKILEVRNFFRQTSYKVTGVFTVPRNTHFQPGIIISYTTFSQQPGFIPDWGWRDFYTYVELKDKGSAENFENKIASVDYVGNHHDLFKKRNMRHHLFLQPVKDIHLYSKLEQELDINGDGNLVYFLLLISGFILIMAWVNYINLATAEAITRAREVGVKKTIGARRRNLVFQFILESTIINLAAFAIGVVVMLALQPAFSQLIGKQINFEIWQDPLLISGLVFTFLLGIVISSFYPAWILSGFSPVKVLKGKINYSPGNVYLRRSLITFQFVMSTLLIMASITVYMQLQHMKSKDLGMDISSTIVIQAPGPADSTVYSGYLAFKNKILQNPSIKNVTASHLVPGNQDAWNVGMRKLSSSQNTTEVGLTAFVNAVEPEFIKNYQLEVIHGRDFSPEFADNKSMIFSETACKRFGIAKPEDAINQKIIAIGDTFTVVGVMRDYHQFGLQRAAEPYVFFQRPDEYRRYSVKVNAADISNTLNYLKAEFASVFPSADFSYYFLDEHFAEQYKADKKLGEIFLYFTGLAIFISCLGLFGLSFFLIVQRTREIGIRKVLGASVNTIVGLLSKDFVVLVTVSAFIAFPLGWWAINQWLQDFAYRIDISWWMFAAAGIGVLITALLTISFHAVKAALANPVKSLRTE